jgi:hypothetical protein
MLAVRLQMRMAAVASKPTIVPTTFFIALPPSYWSIKGKKAKAQALPFPYNKSTTRWDLYYSRRVNNRTNIEWFPNATISMLF